MEFATGALGTLLPKLGQLLQDEYNLHKGAKKNIKFLSKELECIQAALRNVGEVPREELKCQVKIWARDARELSYDMEDIVDTFLVRIQGPDRLSRKSSKRFFKKMIGFVNKAKTRHDIGQEIMDIKERVKEVAERRERYKLDDITPANAFGVDPRITSLYTKAADLIGIDKARDELITILKIGDDMSAQQRIVSVVGFGGLGKTTLAKAVYDNLKGQFDCTAFVPVGRNPELKKVLMDILIDLDKQYMSSSFVALDERQLINEFQELLQKKRYFIIIDDVWDTKSWGTIKLALVENNIGSRIIITTRIHEVAREASEVYKLQPLSNDNSRKLFFARTFDGESNSSYHQTDDDIPNKILKKCEGIPLAIITMASLLVGKPREVWSEVHRSIDFGNKENQQVENTMKILSFSYYDLPPHLRTCLLNLCVFPEDHLIEKGPLIWMWIAEGFVHEKQGIPSFEIGERYFNELVNRSMIQLVQSGYEMVCGCRIHDMVLDLIRSISSEENSVTILENKEEEASPSQVRVRRLALQTNTTVEPRMEMQQVRSFISFGCDIVKGGLLSRFRLVRVLAIHIPSFQWSKHHHMSEKLENLLHLRYLWLSDNSYCRGRVEDTLDLEVGSLKFLQTLDLKGERLIINDVCLLTQLLCLRFRGNVPVLPDGIGKLTSLEELEIFYSGKKEEQFERFVKELSSLRGLRVICISTSLYLSCAVWEDMLDSLCNLNKMEHLLLSVDGIDTEFGDTAAWEAAGFLLPRSLRRLSVEGVIFSRFPSFCINRTRLPNLSELRLDVYHIDEQDLRILGELPELDLLELSVIDTNMQLVCSSTDAACNDCSFHNLRWCRLNFMDALIRLPSKDDSFPMSDVSAYIGLSGSERNDKGAALAPTLMPSVRVLRFVARIREFKDSNDNDDGDCGGVSLEYFVSLQHVTVYINCDGATVAEVEEVEAALRHATDVHPNRPTLYISREGKNAMISASQEQENEAELT